MKMVLYASIAGILMNPAIITRGITVTDVPSRSEAVAENKLLQLVADVFEHKQVDSEDELYLQAVDNWLGNREWQCFLTLTFRDAPWGGQPSYGWLKKCVESVERWNRWADDYPLLLVLERGKHSAEANVALEIPKGTTTTNVEQLECDYLTKGRLHLHGLSANPTTNFVSSFSAMWQELAGHCKVERPRNLEHVSNYVLKYVLKEFHNKEFINNMWMLGRSGAWLTPLRKYESPMENIPSPWGTSNMNLTQ